MTPPARALVDSDYRSYEIDCVVTWLDAWLARSGVVADDGAVAGIVDADSPRYWYPEIAGYYLCYLATLGHSHARAALIVAWLQRWWSDAEFGRETRVFASGRGEPEDWRNRWCFSFDLAMIVRGLGRHPALSGTSALREEIAGELKSRFVLPDGAIAAVVGPPVPPERRRWSTTEGPAQLKTLAALAQTPTSELPLAWCEARAKALLERFPISNWGKLPLHPRCYAMEGMLRLDDSAPVRERVRTLVVEALDHEWAGVDFRRIDVRAQLLRLLLVTAPEDPRVEPLALDLLAALDQREAAPFAINSPAGEYNVWATLFAREALHCLSAPFVDPRDLL